MFKIIKEKVIKPKGTITNKSYEVPLWPCERHVKDIVINYLEEGKFKCVTQLAYSPRDGLPDFWLFSYVQSRRDTYSHTKI